MKVVQALAWYYPEGAGGTEAYVAALSAWLAAQGHEVRIAAPSAGASGSRSYVHDGIPVFRYPIPLGPTRAEAQGDVAVRGAEILHEWLRAERPDVVHLHTLGTGLGLAEATAARDAGARVFVTTHSAALGWICQRGTMMRMGRALCDGLAEPAKCAACALNAAGAPAALGALASALPNAMSAAGAAIAGPVGTVLGMRDLIVRNARRQHALFGVIEQFVVLTAWARDAMIANGAPADRVVLNRLGAALGAVARKPAPAAAPTARPVTIGYVGRYEAIKGPHVLAEAMASLPGEVPLRVVFRGPVRTEGERAVLDALRARAGGDARVTFADEVPRGGVADALRALDVLCCPSLTLEGGPTVAIEAHTVGTPVIGSRIGGLAELVTDGVNGRLVAPGDVTALADVLREIAAAPGEVDRWRAALPAARTMDDVAADTLRMYGG